MIRFSSASNVTAFAKVSLFTSCIALTMLTGCSNRIHYRGKAPDLEALATIQPGQSTKEDVLNIIGSPTFETQFGPKVWYYVSKREEAKAFLPPEVTDKQTIAISFSDNEVVTKVEDLDPELPDIIPAKNKTSSAVPEKPLLKQVFANFGRIAKKNDKDESR